MKKNIKIEELNACSDISQLKNQVCTYHDDDLKAIIDSFQLEMLPGIVRKAIEENKKRSDYVQVSFIRDGLPHHVHDREAFLSNFYKDINSYKDSKFSIRITNLQLFDEQINSYLQKLFKQIHIPISCNLYLTSNSGGNCFLFHPDPQISLIAQLHGRKKWHFPTDENGSYLFKQTIFNIPSEYENEVCFDVKKGDVFAFGHKVLHRAYYQEEEISAHLTFAAFPTNQYDALQHLLDHTDSFINDNMLNYKTDLSENTVKELLDNFITKLKSVDSKLVSTEMQKLKLKKDIDILKKGRRY